MICYSCRQVGLLVLVKLAERSSLTSEKEKWHLAIASDVSGENHVEVATPAAPFPKQPASPPWQEVNFRPTTRTSLLHLGENLARSGGGNRFRFSLDAKCINSRFSTHLEQRLGRCNFHSTAGHCNLLIRILCPIKWVNSVVSHP